MFKIDDIIRFRYTGTRAKIVTDHLDGSYTVWIFEDNEKGIAFFDDIVLESNFKKVEQSQMSVKHQKVKKLSTEEMFFSKEEIDRQKQQAFQKPPSPKKEGSKEIKKEDTRAIDDSYAYSELSYSPATNQGIFLAFVEQVLGKYTIFLVNDSNYSFRFQFELWLNQQKAQSLDHNISPNTYFPIGELEHAQLNDAPTIEFKCPGLGLQESVKLKFKKWVKMEGAVPLMGIEAHRQLLFDVSRIEKNSIEGSQDDLSKYTQDQLKERAKNQPVSSFYKADINKLAQFNKELDLHIEKLVEDPSKLSIKDIFELQMKTLERYILKALELGTDEVYIIHGLGEGVLQKAVHDYLKSNSQVKEYRNEYIAKYGFGATRVRF